MAKEIERKFVVHHVPIELHSIQPCVIRQGYLAVDSNGTEVRIREKGSLFSLTIKSSGSLTREEVEVAISAPDFESLWQFVDGRMVTKKRFVLGHAPEMLEIDVYEGPLAGLVVCEVEFPTEDHAGHFSPLPWMGPEVTANPRFKNRSLAALDSTDASAFVAEVMSNR